MNWKSYAVVSGATVLAGWFASAPPSNTPAGAQATVSRTAQPAAAAPSDIEREAIRLQARLRDGRAFIAPARDPFRFAARREAAAAPGLEGPVAEPTAAPVETAPAGPRVSLSGVAEDQVDGRTERTAILSAPGGILLVREGEEILGYYRVGRIEAEAVEITAIGDGTTRRLTLGAATP